LNVEKREELCFVEEEEEEAIVLVSITRAPLKPYTHGIHRLLSFGA
jgi:hypothetical protein